jgi:carboxypeptidase Taq
MNKYSYQDYLDFNLKISDLNGISSLLQWDQEVGLPNESMDGRARQIAGISGIIHELYTSQYYRDLLNYLENNVDLDKTQKLNIKLSKKDLQRKICLSKEFVEELSSAISNSYSAWEEARSKKDFKLFSPFLKNLIKLKKQEAELIDKSKEVYDVFLDEYDAGLKSKEIKIIFENLKPQLISLLNQIEKKEKIDISITNKIYPNNKQWDFGIEILKEIGFNFNAGKQDISTHPFTINIGEKDIRVTTRIVENNLNEMIWSCLHEGGHALYEQGLQSQTFGIPESEASSLSVHESQSRLWENHIGRGLSFWKLKYKKLQNLFPENLNDIELNEFYKIINAVSKELIRTNADELTYHFHIIIRFEIEQLLFSNDFNIDDLPEVWNELYFKYLGIKPENDEKGILQDVHWAHGSFGYFPTYTLGSLYAAQFYEHAKRNIENLEQKISDGDFSELSKWLKVNIYEKGRLQTSEEICKSSTGESLNSQYFIDYAKQKYTEIYAL